MQGDIAIYACKWGYCVSELIFLVPWYLGCAWAADRFCKKFLRIVPSRKYVFAAGAFIIWLVVDLVRELFSPPYIVAALMIHILLTVLIIESFQEIWEKKVLAAAVLSAAVTLMGNFCVSLCSLLTLILLHTLLKIPEPFLGGWQDGLICYISAAAVVAFLHFLNGRLTEVFNGGDRKRYIIMAVPLLAVTVMMDFVNWGAAHGVLVRSGGNMGIYFDQIFSHGGICIFSALAMLAAGFYLLGLERIYLEQRKSSWYHSQIEAFKMLKGQYRQSERLRHDMKNHIIALSGLLQSRDWGKMEQYLADMSEAGSLGMEEDTTGNRVVDAVLHQKRARAEKNHIQWECEVQIPKSCPINEYDLCVLFGNLLDNALEECERLEDRDHCFIHIRGGKVKQCFLLVISNRAEIRISPFAAAGRFSSSKKSDPEKHGMGLLNVSDIVRKYNGEWEIETGEGRFTISVLMPFGDAVEDMEKSL